MTYRKTPQDEGRAASRQSVPSAPPPFSERDDAHHRVVIVGAGFAGIAVARKLARTNTSVILLDRRNYHLFQPLLYQVAGTSIGPSEIAWPVRSLMRGATNVTTLLGEMIGIDTANHTIATGYGADIAYDTLVLATGVRHSYFGNDHWSNYAHGLKTVEDATFIRRRILLAFEEAERLCDPAARKPYLTFIIIGGGPTGVELAGTLAELARQTMRGEFRHIRPDEVHVLLVEGGPRILPSFDDGLSDYARKALERLGVEVRTDSPVTVCDAEGVEIGNRRVAAKTTLWAAGVEAPPVARWLEAPTDSSGRIIVGPDLTVPNRPEIFVIGDLAHVRDGDGRLVPGVAPAAKQEGQYVARVISARLRGTRPPAAFRYKDAGSLATIGKRAAVVDFGWLKLRGRLAWWLWGVVHIFFLIGVRNRLIVALSWLWSYATGRRSARLITGTDPEEPPSHIDRRTG